MSARAALAELRLLGGRARVADDQVLIRAGKARIPGELVAQLRRHKPEIRRLLEDEAARQHPLVKAVLDTFPGAEIIAIRERKPAT